MLRRGLAPLAFACAPALAACSLLLGEGFTDPNADTVPDGGGDTSSSSSSSSGGVGEGGSTDGNASGDGASSSSGSIGPDAGGLACPTSTFTICDDFERTDPKGTVWASTNLTTGGSLSIETDGSGNRRLATSVFAKGGHGQVSKPFSLTPSKIHMDFSVVVDKLPSVGGIYIAGLFMQQASESPTLVYVYVNGAGVQFVQQVADGVNYKADALTAVTTGAPHHVAVDLTLGGFVTVTIDGNVALNRKAEAYLKAASGAVYCGAGSIDEGGSGSAVVIDDFVFTAD